MISFKNSARYGFAILAALGSAHGLADTADAAGHKSFELVTLTSEEAGRTALGVDFEIDRIELGPVQFSAQGVYSFDDAVRSQDMLSFDFSREFASVQQCYQVGMDTGADNDDAPVVIEPGTLPDGPGPVNSCPWGRWSFGGSASHETDQDFDDGQTVLALTTALEMPAAHDNATFAQFYALLDFVPGLLRAASGYPADHELGSALRPIVSLALGEVDPQQDAQREQLLGGLDRYYRAEGEISLSTPVALFDGKPVLLAYDYRYFRELDADAVIEGANLHRSRLLQFSLRMPSADDRGYAFVGYSSGRLPFGIEDEVLEVGWSYSL
ncbi:hypothetical protein AWR36_000640 [Microbulbifer flavimaris]|uniref:DUF2219 domain-containing protein n=1 Tax=Microbulbifer flavimaris TaxID=1781068 RepID=A0ABX4I1P4_9GAMM|nr:MULTISPECIES: hypothetical protein [Microbulbifer]KUJ84253.1 hypothetical protein AVO43_00640 [Microbulbifer sp. ZGT114]PCO06329.1 hypothetical protein AWR36_000640 [Microbulbifer flavimaris]